MADTYTASLRLTKPEFDKPRWHQQINDDLDIIDAVLTKYIGQLNVVGVWKNSTEYTVGDVVVDSDEGQLYEALATHTSSSSGTFAAFRAANPSAWTLLSLSFLSLQGLSGTGFITKINAGSAACRTITGTTNRIDVSQGDGLLANPTIDISSLYVGQTSITTLGTITTGVWNGSAIPVANGGTGATTAAAARSNLGLTIGSAVQAWDADLDAIAALGSTGIAVRTAANTWAQRTVVGTTVNVTVANGDGVSGNIGIDVGNATAIKFNDGVGIKDANGVNVLTFGTVASAANYLFISNAVAGGTPSIAAVGASTNIGIVYAGKGDANHTFTANGGTQFNIGNTINAVNYVSMTGAGAGGAPAFFCVGTDTNIQMSFSSKGTNGIGVYTNTFSQQQLLISHTASAVNYLNITGAATGSYIRLQAAGSDANVGLNLISAGTGDINFFGGGGITSLQVKITPVNTAVNYWILTGSTTGNNVLLTAAGSDTNVGIRITAQGNSGIDFYANGNRQFRVANNSSAVNYIQVVGTATTGTPALLALGSDTNVTLVIGSQGTGSIDFLTNTNATRQFRVAHTATAVNYLSVSGAVTGNFPNISVNGSDTNVGMFLFTQGTGSLFVKTNAGAQIQLEVFHTASAVNYIQITGSATTAAASIGVAGSDTNITLSLIPKGTGDLRSAAVNSNTTGTAANVNVDGSGNIRRSTSSAKYKTDISNYDRIMDDVLKMRPVWYRSKIDTDDKACRRAGFIAEELHEAGFTEFVEYRDGAPDGVQYPNLAVVAIAGVQSLHTRVSALEAKLSKGA